MHVIAQRRVATMQFQTSEQSNGEINGGKSISEHKLNLGTN